MTIHQHIAAGIDLGSNTFRLLLANHAAGRLTVLTRKMATVGLGRGLEDTGLLHEESMQKGIGVLRTFREILTEYQPQSIRICGTQALRQARNSSLFLGKAEELLQQPIDIICGEEEARLSFAGALAGSTAPFSGPMLLVDVGGGSTELVFAASPAGEPRVTSVPLGVVGLTEKFITAPHADPACLDSLLAETLDSAFTRLALMQKEQPVLIIGCGGTATSMAALDLNLSAYSAALVHGHVLQSSSMEKLWHKLAALPADKRNALPCLGEGRGEILPAGIRIYHVLVKLLQQDRMRVSDSGLLEGITLSGLSPAAT
jgi:exopolyphosphatase/guanosine-5'-triphosphate,3'-diphosphate pyrophosphatase